MSSQETGSTDAPTGPPRNVPLTLNTVGSMVTTADGLPQPPGPTAPLLAAARRAPGPGLSVQHHSLDSGRRPLSSDDGEPLLLPPPPPRPPPHTPLQLQPGAPRPALPEVPFEWVTRGVPPLPPKKTSLCAPRFEWVPGRLECSSTPHPSLAAAHAHGQRSQLPLPWPASTSSSMVPPSYDTARVTLAAGLELQTREELGMRPCLPARLLPSHPSVGPMAPVEHF